MASLRDAIKEQQDELQGGNAWVAFWKEGRSWHSEAFHLDMGATLYPEDEWRLREIEAADPAAIVLNGYLSEDMTLDELKDALQSEIDIVKSSGQDFIDAVLRQR